MRKKDKQPKKKTKRTLDNISNSFDCTGAF